MAVRAVRSSRGEPVGGSRGDGVSAWRMGSSFPGTSPSSAGKRARHDPVPLHTPSEDGGG